MKKPRFGLLIPFVSFYEAIVPLRDEKKAFADRLRAVLSKELELAEADGGLVETEEAASETGKRWREEEVEGVIIAPSLAVFGALPWAALKELPPHIPIAIWHCPALRIVPPDYNIRSLIGNSGGLGVMALANTLFRENRIFRVFDDEVADEIPPAILAFARTSHAAAEVRRARFGIVGSVFPQMTDVLMDSSNWTQTTGQTIISISPEEFTDKCQHVSENNLNVALAQLHNEHQTSDITNDELRRSVRIAVALNQIVDEHQLSGGAFNCHGENCLRNPALGLTGCYAVTQQTSAGRPFSCTGDLPTAVALLIGKHLSGAVIYGELDAVDEARDCVLLANGGEGDAHFSCAPMQVFGNENFTGLHGRGASVSVSVAEGAATILSFTPTNSGGYGLIVAEGWLSNELETAMQGFHATFRFAGKNARRGFRDWCEAGATHHLALMMGRWAMALRLLGEIFKWEVQVVANHEEVE